MNKQRRQSLPSKAAMLREIEHWKWQATALAGGSAPMLIIPGMIVYVDTKDLTDIDERFAIFELAKKNLLRRLQDESRQPTRRSTP